MTQDNKTRGRVDFAALNAALMANAESLCFEWIGGRRDMQGPEWKAARQSEGGMGDSLSVNLHTGVWSHFAADESGGDLVSLFAYVQGLTQIEAARQLWDRMGMGPLIDDRPDDRRQARDDSPPWDDDDAPNQGPESAPAQANVGVDRPARGPAKPVPKAADKRRSDWTPVVPVPASAPDAQLVHPHRGKPTLSWAYRKDGALYGYVCRFTTSDGGKDTIPFTWCRNDFDPVVPGASRWHWKGWDAPRPLYLPGGRLREAQGDTLAPMVLVVEGEKCAEACHRLLGEAFDVVSWPGGVKQIPYADWAWIAGRRVLFWPDTDSHREKLSKAEREAIVDPASKPFLELDKQPGNAAALKAAELLNLLGCTVYIVPFIGPGIKPDGWDSADALAGIGVEAPWQLEETMAYLKTARRWQPPEAVQNEAAKLANRAAMTAAQADRDAGGEDEDGEPAGHIIRGWPHFADKGPKATRENILHAFKHDKALQGLVGLNEFSQELWKLKATPWESPAGIWREVDDYLLAEYLVLRHNWVQSPSADAIGQAMKTLAYQFSFHPVRDRLLARAWDGTDRLDGWLFEALGLDVKRTSARGEYIARVGRWYIMGMVARVLRPGCKFDYMLVLEGPQGYKKSTLGRVLAGEYFSDTHIDLGNKDSYLQLQGCWVHEFSELHAITGKDVTLVKAFISAPTDYLRAPFDRRPAKYPRQCVFFGTSNNGKWARDRTGNRRFWPVEIQHPVNTDWVEANLDQLLAEAVHRVQAGERYHPTYQEEIDWFQPQQAKRVQSTATEEALFQYLCGDRDGGKTMEAAVPKQVTLMRCLEGIGIDASKAASNRMVQSEVIELLHKWGWTHKRAGTAVGGKRPWVYVRPDVWPPAESPDPDDEDLESTAAPAGPGNYGPDNDVPF